MHHVHCFHSTVSSEQPGAPATKCCLFQILTSSAKNTPSLLPSACNPSVTVLCRTRWFDSCMTLDTVNAMLRCIRNEVVVLKKYSQSTNLVIISMPPPSNHFLHAAPFKPFPIQARIDVVAHEKRSDRENEWVVFQVNTT